jgi:hypothetical protein
MCNRLAWLLIALTLGCDSQGGGADVLQGPAGGMTAGGMTVSGSGAVGGAAMPMAGTDGGNVGGVSAAGDGGAAASTGGATSGTGGAASMAGTESSMAGSDASVAGAGGMAGTMHVGACCDDCVCHGDAPDALTSEEGPYATEHYEIADVGCVSYPTDAEAPFAALAFNDGLSAPGGCFSSAAPGWGPFYASHGIVVITVSATRDALPPQRGEALVHAIAVLKAENESPDSPLFEKLAGRYGVAGFSMGGGGATYAAQTDPSFLTNVAIMPFEPVDGTVTIPTLLICGSADQIAPCDAHGVPFYEGIDVGVAKMRVTVLSGHSGQPTTGGGSTGAVALAFQKVFLEGDERWRALLLGAASDDTSIP